MKNCIAYLEMHHYTAKNGYVPAGIHDK